MPGIATYRYANRLLTTIDNLPFILFHLLTEFATFLYCIYLAQIPQSGGR